MHLPGDLAGPGMGIACGHVPLGRSRGTSTGDHDIARVLRLLPALLGALLATAGAALAEEAKPAWPSRPVSIVVPYVPGGPSDLLARALAGPLQVAIGQPVVVENRTGQRHRRRAACDAASAG